MLASNLRKVFAFVFVLGGLLAAYQVSSGALASQEPVDGAGAPELPEVDEEDADLTMTTSYYGYALAGNPTASGETFDPERLTAAHKTLPLGTKLLVERGGESVRVTVNDRGPYVAGRDLDLSVGAAREIGLTGPGEDRVNVILL